MSGNRPHPPPLARKKDRMALVCCARLTIPSAPKTTRTTTTTTRKNEQNNGHRRMLKTTLKYQNQIKFKTDRKILRPSQTLLMELFLPFHVEISVLNDGLLRLASFLANACSHSATRFFLFFGFACSKNNNNENRQPLIPFSLALFNIHRDKGIVDAHIKHTMNSNGRKKCTI